MQVTYKNYREKIGAAIKAKREEEGLSQEGLAAKIEGICTQTIVRIETGSYPKDLTLFTIQAVCNELKLPVNMNFGGAS